MCAYFDLALEHLQKWCYIAIFYLHKHQSDAPTMELNVFFFSSIATVHIYRQMCNVHESYKKKKKKKFLLVIKIIPFAHFFFSFFYPYLSFSFTLISSLTLKLISLNSLSQLRSLNSLSQLPPKLDVIDPPAVPGCRSALDPCRHPPQTHVANHLRPTSLLFSLSLCFQLRWGPTLLDSPQIGAFRFALHSSSLFMIIDG